MDINGAQPTISTGAGGTTGTLNGDSAEVFNNIPLYDFIVKKTVSGNMGNKYKDFEFEVKVGGWETAIKDKISDWQWNSDWGFGADFSENHSQDLIKLGTLINAGQIPKTYYGNLRIRVVVNGVVRVDESCDDFIALSYNNNSITGGMLKITPDRIAFSSGTTGETMELNPGDVLELQYYEYLDLTDYGGIPKVDEDDDGIADDGVYIFKLKHDDTITIPQIPGGYQYEVKEKDYSGIGYITTVDGTLGRQASGTLMENTEHEFENNLSVVIPTKAFAGMLTPILGLMFIAIAWFILKRLKMTDLEDDI